MGYYRLGELPLFMVTYFFCRPPDPIEYVAAYLLKHKDRYWPPQS